MQMIGITIMTGGAPRDGLQGAGRIGAADKRLR
jgi:hypothetical protein